MPLHPGQSVSWGQGEEREGVVVSSPFKALPGLKVAQSAKFNTQTRLPSEFFIMLVVFLLSFRC